MDTACLLVYSTQLTRPGTWPQGDAKWVVARSIADVHTRLGEARPDVVVCDLSGPNLDLLERARTTASVRSIVGVMGEDASATARAVNRGLVDLLLPAGASGDEMQAVLTEALGRRRAADAEERAGVEAGEDAPAPLRPPLGSMAQLIHNLPGMVFYARPDAERTMAFVSDGCREMLGYDPVELVEGDAVSYHQLIHPDDRPSVGEAIERALAGRFPYRLTYRVRTASDDKRWVREFGRGIRSDADGLVYVEGFITDVTVEKRQEDALKEAKEQAEELSRLKSTLLANMSHELRTPLTSIIGFAEILSDEVDGEAADLMKMILESGLRLMQTLNDVLDFAQIESGTYLLAPSAFDLREVIRDIGARYQRYAREADLVLEVKTEARPLVVDLDKGAVRRVLCHLVNNAVKFTREGGVYIDAVDERDEVAVRVSDTGVGMSAAFLPHAFEEFRQESGGLARSHEGAGLGLTITRRLVNMMGGSIDVESADDAGTAFTVRLPKRMGTSRHAREHAGAG